MGGGAERQQVRVQAAKVASPRSVLVVDDRKDVAATMAEMCVALGFEPSIGAEGENMAVLLDLHHPTCVICDVMMPGQDGFEALKEIVRYDPTLPVLLVTGHGDPWLKIGETLGRAQGLSMIHTAAKPLRLATMRAFLDAVAGRGDE